MQIRCKIAPYTWGWSDPKRRFVFKNSDWKEVDLYSLTILKSKLGKKFEDCFETRAGAYEPVKKEEVKEQPVETGFSKFNRRK
jgi:hypothetical protein